MKLKEAPLYYIHWIVHSHHSDKSFDWIKEKHPEAIKNAEIQKPCQTNVDRPSKSV